MRNTDSIGYFTASNMWKLFVEGKGVTRETYIMEVAEERASKSRKPSLGSKATEHGEFNEFEALETFERLSGLNVEYLEQKFFPINEWCGATPDAVAKDFDGNIIAAIEAKCPVTDFFRQKIMMLRESKPEFQNSPRNMFYQAQTQMLALGCNEVHLVRYLTSTHVDDAGNKLEFDLPIGVRMLHKRIVADQKVQKLILLAVEEANKECELYVELFLKELPFDLSPTPLIQKAQ